AKCPPERSACIQISRLALNWPLCPSLQIQIIKANAVPLCAVAMGTGTAAASSLLFALAGNQSLRGGVLQADTVEAGTGAVGGLLAYK
ncbi:Hydroxyethylthiazole kinase, partial [Dissostichus eleginoides]